MDSRPLAIVGAHGSPYSRKLRAVLRYRRIPHRWIHQGAPESIGLPEPRVALLPRLLLPDDAGRVEARTDSTPLILELETLGSRDRSVVPPDPVVALLDALIEDYADEWLTKAMFHYRWAHAPDVEKARLLLPRGFDPTQSDAELERAGRSFARRQIERLAVVGSSDATAATIEEGYARLLDLLEDHLRRHRFVLGARPGRADFGLHGQLTQLALFDPTPSAIALRRAARVPAWTEGVEDLSGLEPSPTDWLDREGATRELRPFLGEIGRVYVPFLLANARALEQGAERVECEIDGRPWVQRPFPYQRKCLAWLREAHDALSTADRGALSDILAGTGCDPLFASDPERSKTAGRTD